MPSRAVLARIGYMTQSDGIYPGLTVGENARFFAAVYGVRDRGPVDDALVVVDLADRVDDVAGTLSGGQRRRLSLACALVHRPPVLFLDEPTVGIDPLLRVEFWTHFRALAADGATIVVSSHVMDEADRCDELLFIRSGKVIARGTSARGPGPGRDGRPGAGVSAARGRRGGDPMSGRRVVAIFRRVVQEIRRDHRSVALLLVVPVVMTGLIAFIVREGESPAVSAVVVNPAGPPGLVVAAALGAALEADGRIGNRRGRRGRRAGGDRRRLGVGRRASPAGDRAGRRHDRDDPHERP